MALGTPNRGIEDRQILGAALLSSLGSCPVHVMPLLVAATASSGRLPVFAAGTVSSTYWLGVLFATLLLPLASISRVTRTFGIACSMLLPLLLAASVFSDGTFFIVGWLLIGLLCGTLNFAGSTFAAAIAIPHRVIALRLAVTLLAAFATLSTATLLGTTTSYGGAALTVASIAALVAMAGSTSYRTPPKTEPTTRHRAADLRMQVAIGIAVVILFFAGQPGFLAYSAQIALSNGMRADTIYIAFAVSKLVGACALALASLRSTGPSPAMLCTTVAAAILLIARATDTLILGVGLLLWELAINPLSARLQSAFVQLAPSISGRLLPASIGVGACLGPALHGAFIYADLPAMFAVYSAASAFLPLVIVRHSLGQARR